MDLVKSSLSWLARLYWVYTNGPRLAILWWLSHGTPPSLFGCPRMCRSFWLVSSGQPLLAIEGSIIYGSIVMWGPTYKSCRRSKPSPPSVPPKQYMERPRWWTWYTRKRSLTLTPFWLLKSVLRHCTATLIWNAAKQINRKQVIGAGHRSLRESNRDSGNESSRNHNNDSNNRRSWN